MTEFAASLRPFRLRSLVPLVLIGSALLIAPLSLRALNRAVLGVQHNVSYLPSSEIRRTRRAFSIEPIDTLRAVAPRWVFIGDSMLGTRVHPELLHELSEDGTQKVWFLMHAASGPAWWYLSFKNHLVPSGVRPRVTFFVFRDTNLTDTTFRLHNLIGDALDEVAHEREPELDAIVAARQRGAWWRIDRALNAAYEVDTTYAWLHPTVRRWYALWKYPEPGTRLAFEQLIEDDLPSPGCRADHARPEPAEAGRAGRARSRSTPRDRARC